MNITGPDEINSKASGRKPEGEFLGRMRTVALMAVVVGAAGSVALMLREGQRSDSIVLLILFTIWVLSPFVALLLANTVSKRWSVLTRMTLYSVMLILSMSSLTIYGILALRPPSSTPAFVFVVVPLGSWLLMMVLGPAAAIISGKRSRRAIGD